MHTLEIDKKPIWEMKATLKQMAEDIRTLKSRRKPKNQIPSDVNQWGHCTVSDSIATLKYNYRHMHIAYCELRGKRYEQIEPKVGEFNKPSRSSIDEYKGQYYIPQVKHVSTVCVSQM